MLRPRAFVVASMIAAAAASRLLPHPPDVTAVTAIALFGGAYFADKRLAFLVPLTALFATDVVIGFYRHMEIDYLTFTVIVCLGMWLQQRRRVLPIAGATIASSLLFFVTSDFATWAFGTLYPKTVSGLVACYVAAVPFLANSIIGDLLFTGLLFGGFALLESRFAALRTTGMQARAA